MADSVNGRRKRGRPDPKESELRKTVRTLREEGNVSKEELSEALGKFGKRTFRSSASQKRLLKALLRRKGGTHATQLPEEGQTSRAVKRKHGVP